MFQETNNDYSPLNFYTLSAFLTANMLSVMMLNSLQRSVVLGHVGERSFGADHVFIHAGFLHPHHAAGILLFLLL